MRIGRITGRGASMLVAVACLSAGIAFGDCGPFSDTSTGSFCGAIEEAFYAGLTNGTSATTFGPEQGVTRDQMAAFITRTLNQATARSNRRAALDQWWQATTPRFDSFGTTAASDAHQCRADGADIWVSIFQGVSRVRASDGKLLGTWTPAPGPSWHPGSVLVALGRIFTTNVDLQGAIDMADPTQDPGEMTQVAQTILPNISGMTFDGTSIWTSHIGEDPNGGDNGVTIITPGSWTMTPVTTGFTGSVTGIAFDGSNVWVTMTPGSLLKLDANGAILQTVSVGGAPTSPTFDGANIWVVNSSDNSISVVRTSSGAVVATLTGNGLNGPTGAAFDGQRVLVTNHAGNSVSVWRAADLSPLGTESTGASSQPVGACSDGVNFWVALAGAGELGRY
ncbi:MAG TPA: S-layer homology domain-containing protein [Thermoanaerobaculia bacterium]|nr:S-layer homology domain-containing protein [Thermoanaerobaculia bacterium]